MTNPPRRKKLSFHPMRLIVLTLCLLAATCFAQSETTPIAEVDSAAYYEKVYEYNHRKFRTDESVSDVLFWTSVGLSAVAPISAMMLGAWSMGCNVNEDNDCEWSALEWGLATPLFLFLPSWTAYGVFSLAKIHRHNKYNQYYKKREDYIKRKQLEKNGAEEQLLSIQVLPLADPVKQRYGALIALGF